VLSKVSLMIISGITILSISGLSYGISRYNIEQAKPDKERTLTLANEAYDRNDYRTASSLYKRYIDIFDKTNVSVMIDYGYSLHNTGRSDEGIQILKSVISKDKNNAFALFNIAVIYYQRKDITNAKFWLSKCSETSSSPEISQRAISILNELQSIKQ